MFYILTKENCEWCDKAKFLLAMKGVPYGAFNYRTHPLFPFLLKSAGLGTVPQIWMETPNGKTHIGGYSELETYFHHQENEMQ